MKATLILSLLLLLTLVRSQSLFEEKFLLGSHKKDKEDNEHKKDYENIMKEEIPIYSKNERYLAKLHKDGDLALYEIKDEGESHQVLLWSTQLSEENKGFKRILFVTKNGNLLLRKADSSKSYDLLWSSKCPDYKTSTYHLGVTDDGNLCLYSKKGREVWCNYYEKEDCDNDSFM